MDSSLLEISDNPLKHAQQPEIGSRLCIIHNSVLFYSPQPAEHIWASSQPHTLQTLQAGCE